MSVADQGLNAAALSEQNRQRQQEIRDAQRAIHEAQRLLAEAEQKNGGQ